MSSRTFTAAQVAKIKRVHVKTVHHWVKTGVLPDRRLPGQRKHVWLAEDFTAPVKNTGE